MHDHRACPHCGHDLQPAPYLMAQTPEGAPAWVARLGVYALVFLIAVGVFAALH